MSNICTYEEEKTCAEYEIIVFGEVDTRNSGSIYKSKKVRFGQRLNAGRKSAGVGVLFVITYHLKLIKIVKRLEHLLCKNKSVKRVFTPPPMVSYRNTRKLSSYLVRAKLYPLKRKRGSYKCGNSRCQVCNNIEKIDTVTGESFKINHRLCCNDKCLINFLT